MIMNDLEYLLVDQWVNGHGWKPTPYRTTDFTNITPTGKVGAFTLLEADDQEGKWLLRGSIVLRTQQLQYKYEVTSLRDDPPQEDVLVYGVLDDFNLIPIILREVEGLGVRLFTYESDGLPQNYIDNWLKRI